MADPYTVPIGPHRFAVVSNPQTTKRLTREGKYGETSIDELTLYLRGDLPATLFDETLNHEVLHAILAVTGMATRLGEQLEEDVVAAISPLLTQAVRTLGCYRVPVK